jgi:hypothetical protein
MVPPLVLLLGKKKKEDVMFLSTTKVKRSETTLSTHSKFANQIVRKILFAVPSPLLLTKTHTALFINGKIQLNMVSKVIQATNVTLKNHLVVKKIRLGFQLKMEESDARVVIHQ